MMEMNYHDNDGEEKYEDYYDSSMGDSKTASSHSSSSNATLYDIDHRLVAVLYRLEAIYTKLTICMRYVVRAAFAKHSDVLEAGTEVQVCVCVHVTLKEFNETHKLTLINVFNKRI